MSGEQVELLITALSTDGRGIARLNDRAIFVSGALPGDLVSAEINLASEPPSGRISTIVTRSQDRVSHPCPHAEHCTASAWGALSYQAQCEHKTLLVRHTLRKQHIDAPVSPIVPSPLQWRYRQRITPSVWQADEKLRIGFRTEPRSVLGFPISQCWLPHESVDRALSAISGRLRELDISRAKPVPARIQVHRTKEGAGVLLTFREQCSKSAADRWFMAFDIPEISGGVWCVSGDRAGIAHSSPKVYGSDRSSFMQTTYDGRLLDLHPLSFCQANPSASDLTITHIRERYTSLAIRCVWDLYGGFGALGIAAAPPDRSLFVFEFTSQSHPVFDELTRERGILRNKFISGDLLQSLPRHLSKLTRDDLVILDPPRSGVHPEVLRMICESPVRMICYLSCNPARLARDMRSLLNAGFRPESIVPYDYFPHTTAIEVLAIFERH